MLVIRREQYKYFEDASDRVFEDEMVVHLSAFAGRHCEVIGERGVRNVIRLGRHSCRRYGLAHKGPVRFFIELMFMFGSYFDTDVQHEWVGAGLRNEALSDMFRADALHEQMTGYLAAVSGPENIFAKNALAATRRLASEVSFASVSDLENTLMAQMQTVYPEKCAWLGPTRLQAVLAGGIASADAVGVTTSSGRATFGVLAFALGHRFADDPLYPWVATTLNTGDGDADSRAERLQEKALLYLDRVLLYLARS